MASDLRHHGLRLFTALTTPMERKRAALLYRWIAGRQHGVALWLLFAGASTVLLSRWG